MDFYQALAEAALAQCPPAYDQIRITAELDDGYAEVELVCLKSSGEIRITDYPITVAADMHDALDGIREEMAVASGRKWTKCVFQASQSGKFKFDVEY